MVLLQNLMVFICFDCAINIVFLFCINMCVHRHVRDELYANAVLWFAVFPPPLLVWSEPAASTALPPAASKLSRY